MRFGAIIIVICLFLVSSYAAAAEPSTQVAAADEGELAELLSILDEETDIATKTKQNADYTPGIITVLHGEQLEALGTRTVWEALGHVPGVETTINSLGRPIVMVRGLGYGFIGGHIKVLVNGVAANITGSGVNDTVLQIPVEQVERIEIIRGAGSAVYGDNAYSGVVNVILKNQGSRIHASAGSFGRRGGGGHFTYTNPGKELSLTLNVAGWKTDGADVDSGPDAIVGFYGQPGVSISPGDTNEDEDVQSVNIVLRYKKTSLDFYSNRRSGGAYFGTDVLWKPSDDKTIKEEYWSLNAAQGFTITPGLEGEVNFNIFEAQTDVKEHMIYPPGFVFDPPGPTLPFVIPDGAWSEFHQKEKDMKAGLDLRWTGMEGHDIVIEASWKKADTTEGQLRGNITLAPPFTIFPAIVTFPDEFAFIPKDTERRTYSLMLQDQIKVTDSFTLTATGRYDDFDDTDDSFNGRLAGVWRPGGAHIIKLQYASGSRLPSFFDIAQNPDLEPEKMNLYEAGYIYRKPGLVARATVFYAKLDNMIVETGLFPVISTTNSGELHTGGAEAEVEYQLTDDYLVSGNLSYADAYDEANTNEVGGGANWHGNLMLRGKLTENTLLGLRYRFVGERNRTFDDTRDELEGYDTVDATLSRYNLLVKGLTLRAGLINAFDENIKAPAFKDTYEKDLPRAGRQWRLQLSKEL